MKVEGGYLEFFGLTATPFPATAQRQWAFPGASYETARAALARGIVERRGFLCLLGETGTGKTLLLRQLLDTPPPHVRALMLLHPEATFEEIVEWLAGELGLAVEGDTAAGVAAVRAAVAAEAAGDGNVALLIDEAQALPMSTLAALPGLVVPLETGGAGLQIVLAGPPALSRRLADARLRERVATRAYLGALAPREIGAYMSACLEQAGAADTELFDADAVDAVGRLTLGSPRLVNALCDLGLAAAAASGSRTVALEHVQGAWAEYLEVAPTPAPTPPVTAPSAALPAAAPPPPPPPGPAPMVEERLAPIRPAIPAPQPRSALIPAAAVALLVLAITVARVAIRPRGAPAPPTTVRLAPAEPLPTAAEALDVVDAFRRAYEARDVSALNELLAPEAAENGRIGTLDAAAESAMLEGIENLVYAQPTARVVPRGRSLEVRAPFVIQYRDRDGRAGELHGTSIWQIARRGGASRIIALTRQLAPGSVVPGRHPVAAP